MTETELVRGHGILVPNTYWGFLLGSVFVGRYSAGGAVCLFMKEVTGCGARPLHTQPPTVPIPPPPSTAAAGNQGGGEAEERDCEREECEECAVLREGEQFEGILVWPGPVLLSSLLACFIACVLASCLTCLLPCLPLALLNCFLACLLHFCLCPCHLLVVFPCYLELLAFW